MFMSPTCAQEIEEKIDKLKIGKASGPDGISASFLKHGKKSIANFLADLINECLVIGFSPAALKGRW